MEGDQPATLEALALALVAAGRQDDAKALLTDALARAPRDAGVRVARGKVLAKLGNREGRSRSSTRPWRSTPTRSRRTTTGLTLMALGRYADAAGDCERLVRAEPRNGHFHLMNGACLLAAGKTREAKAALQAAVDFGKASDREQARAKLAELAKARRGG